MFYLSTQTNRQEYRLDSSGPSEKLSRLDEEQLEFTCRDSEGKPLDPPPVLNVMLVGWKGSVAYRIGIGEIMLARWESCNPTFRTIALM